MARGTGRDFLGTYDIATGGVRLLEGGGAKTGQAEKIEISELAGRNQNLDAGAIEEELALVSEACKPFELDAFREGHLTPVFFGSALRNFGVGDLLEGLGRYAPPPRAQDADKRKVEADDPKMSAFVFKIQANMDPNHRDRIAFARLCSGKLTRGMKAKLVRTGKNMSLSSPQFFFAQDRAIADEAYAGDVVGIPNHGTLRIGDTLTEGEDINFVGVPSFAPEILRRVRLTDAMKAKKLKEALQQMSEEGVVQVFRPRDGAPALVGVVGSLQLDVLKARLEAEYTLPVDFEISEFQLARWISSDDRKKLEAFVSANGSGVADDVDGDPVFLAKNQFYLGLHPRARGRHRVLEYQGREEEGLRPCAASPPQTIDGSPVVSRTIYLANPLGFSEAGSRFIREIMTPELARQGLELVNPFDLVDPAKVDALHAMEAGAARREAWRALNAEIGAVNVAAIDRCHAMLAVLDGSDVDSGTASEIGYAFARGKRIVGYRGDFRSAAENEGSIVNLQVEYFIRASGGTIVTNVADIAAAFTSP